MKKDTPTWFRAKLSEPSPFAALQFETVDEFKEWLQAQKEFLEGKDTGPLVQGLHAVILRDIESFRQKLQAKDWAASDPFELVDAVYHHAGLMRGVDAIVPPPLDLPWTMRWDLYINALIRGAYEALREKGREPWMQRAVENCRRAVYYLLAGRGAGLEIVRRGEGQVGYQAALIALFMAEGEALPLAPIERLETAVRASHYKRHEEVMPTKEQRDLGGQVILTVDKRMREEDPLVTLARSLDGGWNIILRAIQDDLTKQERKHTKEQQFPEFVEDKKGKIIPAGPATLKSSQPNPQGELERSEEEAAREDAFQRFLAEPHVQEIIEAVHQGAKTQVEIGTKLGKSDRTIRDRLKKLREKYPELFGR